MRRLAKTILAVGLAVVACGVSSAALAGGSQPLGAYVQVLGGGSLPGNYYYYDQTTGVLNATDTTAAAFAGAAAVGYDFMQGLSGEVDLFYVHRDTLSSGKYPLTTASVMANLKYTVNLNDTVGLFGAVGVGGMYMRLDDTVTGLVYTDGWGLGYQLQAGATVKLSDNISALLEYRYENSFSPIRGRGSYDSENAPQSVVLAGLQVGF